MSPDILYIDTETRSFGNLKQNGTYSYFEDPEYKLLLVSYALNNENPVLWDPQTEKIPLDLDEALTDREVLKYAHNAPFDMLALRTHFKWLGWLEMNPRVEDWRCTMVQALSHSLPGALADLGAALGMPADKRKLASEAHLIRLFCCKQAKNARIQHPDKTTHPEEWERFRQYALQDVVALREVRKRMPAWNYPNNRQELMAWFFDQLCNDHGVLIDVDFVDAVLRTVEGLKADLDTDMQAKTHGMVRSLNQRDAFLETLQNVFGAEIPDLQASTLEYFLRRDDLPPELRELIELRLTGAKSSVSKFQRAREALTDGNRLRGTLQFCGADRTGRDAGRLIQPQNMVRASVDPETIEYWIDATKKGLLPVLEEDPLSAISKCSRGMIIAPEGKYLGVGDYSNIESRVLAWLADERWKLDAFRDQDAGRGTDVYEKTYAAAFAVPDVTPAQRQIGKVMDLAFSYGGGVGALLTMATGYGFDLDELGSTAWDAASPEVREMASASYDWALQNKRAYGMEERTHLGCEALKHAWRNTHPRIVDFWKAVEESADNPEAGFVGSWVQYDRIGPWFRLRLPSGRYLSYPSMIRDPDTNELTHLGRDQKTKKWTRLKTYGGKLVENITQAAARDILIHHLKIVVDRCGPVVLRVHDEFVVEMCNTVPLETLHKSMLMPLPWLERTFPLAAKVFKTQRYRKD